MSDLHEWRRVLVVDDSPENVRLLNEILAGDYQVLFATSGAMALEVARAQNPDLILLDVMMPEMDGYQVCNELKRDPATDRIPIIFLTGKDRDEDEALGFGLGAADYLAKPVRPAVVKMRVRNQLELKRNEDLILRQALYDPLTTLPNRQLVLERLKVMLKDSLRDNLKIALLFIDLDDFKQVNDTLGHEGGDQLLVEAARRLRESVRAVDTVGRLGGDEFTIILPRLANIESPKLIAENILQAFARPFSLVGRELIVTPSIGITVSPDDGSAPKLMLRNADTAMYKSKQRGRNTYHFFTQAMNEDVMRRLELEHHLLHALERGEFAVHYQPIIELAGRRPVGAEALLRWNNPELGSIPPDEFVILAEQKGLISEIGEFVIDTGCRLFNKLQNGADHPLYLTVNVSPQQFRRQGLPEAVGRILRQAGFPPHRLEVEVTEGLLLSEHGGIKADLELLREQGIRISMDDFGTGYSSLSYLRCFPFGVLKIDRSFITDLGNGPAAQGLIRAAIAMAHSLGLKVVAEGVETEAQRAFLEAEGCDMAQGYLFARPLDADGFTGFLESWIQT